MAKVAQTKDKDFDTIEPRLSFTDMAEERKQIVVEICREAYSKLDIIIHNLLHLKYLPTHYANSPFLFRNAA